MLSYVCEFNLDIRGEEAERFLAGAARDWPALYAELPGVHRTLLLANAFGLAGPYTYLWRVDIEGWKTLQTIDDALKSDDKRWRSAREEWFHHRTEVRARLLRTAGDEYGEDSGDGLVHYVLSHGSPAVGVGEGSPTGALRKELSGRLGKAGGVQSVQHLTAVVQPTRADRYEAWSRLDSLDALEGINEIHDRELAPLLRQVPVNSRLYGELREVDGALVAGA